MCNSYAIVLVFLFLGPRIMGLSSDAACPTSYLLTLTGLFSLDRCCSFEYSYHLSDGITLLGNTMA